MAVTSVRFRRLVVEDEDEGRGEELENGSSQLGMDYDHEDDNASNDEKFLIDMEEDKKLAAEHHESKRAGKTCVLSSWKSVVLGLAVFTIAIAISLLIYKLVKEPTPPFHPGELLISW